MKLHVVNSNSRGNGYVLESSAGDQLLIEAGRPLSEFRINGQIRLANTRGMIVSHCHGDHARYIPEFLRMGIEIGSTIDVHDKYHDVKTLEEGSSYTFGPFSVTPFRVKHDVPCLGYLVHHPEMGVLFFATDCYDLRYEIHGIRHFLIEANYNDSMLDKAVKTGLTSSAQADRIRKSHMSCANAIKYLAVCHAEDYAHTITIIHGSPRHLNPASATDMIRQEFGVPTFYATKGVTINLM